MRRRRCCLVVGQPKPCLTLACWAPLLIPCQSSPRPPPMELETRLLLMALLRRTHQLPLNHGWQTQLGTLVQTLVRILV